MTGGAEKYFCPSCAFKGVWRVKKRVVFCVMVVPFFIACVAFAQEQTARLAAQNFLSFVNSPKTIVSVSPLETRLLDPLKPAVLSGWVFNLNDGGYLLISASQNRFPVKAYSAELDNDILTIQPKSGSQNKAVTVRIIAESGGENISADFIVMVADGDVT